MMGVAKATEVLCTCHLQRKNRIMDTLSENLVGNNYEFVIFLSKDASYNVVAIATEVLRTNHLQRK